MMKINAWLLAVFVCLVEGVLPAFSLGREGHYIFTHLTMDDGLPQNYVEDLMKDSQGFLWISTGGDGVTRYDGYEFLTFNAFSGKVKLKNNFVSKFCEDRFGRIWMAGEQGLDILDARRLVTVRPESLGGGLADFAVKPSSFVYCSSTGNIWMAADDGLYKISLTAEGRVDAIVRICDLYPFSRSLVFCEADGYIWFDCIGRLCLIKESVSTAQQPVPAPDSFAFLSESTMLCLFHWQNDMWIGTNTGLYRYSINTGITKSYLFDEHDSHSLSQNYVTDMNLAPDGTLVVATLKGLNLYNAVTDDFIRIQQPDGGTDINGLSCNFINCLLADKNMLWIGTEVGGLNKMLLSPLQIHNYRHSFQDKGSISGNLVNAILEEDDGTLWVGTVERGLNLRRPGKTGFEHYTAEPPARLSHNSVSALASDGQTRMYVGTWGGGLGWVSRSNLSDKTFHPIPMPGATGSEQGYISVLLYDAINRLLWIGSSDNLLVYNPETGKVSDPFEGKRKGKILGSLGGCITHDGFLWMGVTAGLYRIDLNAYKEGRMDYVLYDHKLDNPSEVVAERVTSVFEGKDGTVWIGTNGNGFYQVTGKGKDLSFKAYRTSDGLINNSVRGIWEDNEGHLWLATNNGLSCFMPKNQSFQNFTKYDGLPSNQFYWNATGGSHTGALYVGSIEGLSEIRILPRAETAVSFPLVFTHLSCFGEELQAEEGVLSIHERDKSLTVNFASLDYNPSALARYAYRLKGFNDEWVTVPATQHSVSYSSLEAGKYTFQLRYASDGKNFVSPVRELSIRVIPYFYKTMWFKLIIVLCVLLVIYWRFRDLQRQQKLLRLTVEERTHELEEQKKLLSDQKEELSHQNELLKDSNEKITSQKNKILEMSRKVEELTIDKLAFFTNITHEFRTPLTLIVGPIERALKLSYNPQVIEQLHLVERNSKYLLSLINQLMDFRKVEEGRMKVVSNYGDLKRFLEELLPAFADYARGRGVDFRCFVHLADSRMILAEDILHKILTNLISNALKFTQKDGCVSVYVASLQTEAGERLFIGVRDTGKGIPEGDLGRIFDCFYQSDNQSQESVSGQSGTGIGLYLCKKLVDSLEGSISVKNNPVRGSNFRVLLPLVRGDERQIKTETSGYVLPEIPKNSKLTMLVVEDNKDMRDYIRSILGEYYNVLEASQGEEALQILKSYNVDFIISDLMMPVMDGVELSRRVKSDFSISHIPFLMLTAKTSDEARLESYRMGVDAYLLKPFDENMLLARISNILENRKRFQMKFSMNMNVDSLEVEEYSGDKKFLDKAIKVVKENYKNPEFEVGDFIVAMGISKSLLNKKMQSLTGQSAGQFMRNYRLNLARELLLKNKVTRSMNISEIAYEVGFNDPKYFTRCFTKHFNVTPSSLLEE